ncbi:hypothetical protein O181_044090 [Austropuccinia psidii MF-1]|uniref:Uncharacterized protein n=1 Tax=Austropuccinia psidii MF-1 TaxID=1389203 RepID=A0A9Q3DJF8_9BASI|nr:hypothetical protein [Austropuccinia psidii MF-1]
MKEEILVTKNLTSQQIILAKNYLKIYCIEINNHELRYFTIGENKTQNVSFSNIPKQISILSSSKDTYKKEFVSNQPSEAQINQALSAKMRQELSDVLYTYKDAFSSDNEPLGLIRENQVDINLHIYRLYHPVLKRHAYPANPRARESLEKHIQELIQLGLLKNMGHNKEVKVKTPGIISWHNDESRMVGYLRALNTYAIQDRYSIPGT